VGVTDMMGAGELVRTYLESDLSWLLRLVCESLVIADGVEHELAVGRNLGGKVWGAPLMAMVAERKGWS
jgi:hypothetical protein